MSTAFSPWTSSRDAGRSGSVSLRTPASAISLWASCVLRRAPGRHHGYRSVRRRASLPYKVPAVDVSLCSCWKRKMVTHLDLSYCSEKKQRGTSSNQGETSVSSQKPLLSSSSRSEYTILIARSDSRKLLIQMMWKRQFSFADQNYYWLLPEVFE